jgi:protein-S-isoprenylcysteine O-methyltransferase Ste14
MPTAPPPDHSGVRFPPPFAFAIPFCIGLLIHRFYPIGLGPREILAIPGLILAVGGFLLVLFAMGFFVRARTSPLPIKPTTAIVATGPYRFTRNPMYVGMTLLYVGLALWLDSLWPLLLLPAALWVVQRYVIAREEVYLEAKFGDEYRRYKERVRRWI